jgi:hypothetical protein
VCIIKFLGVPTNLFVNFMAPLKLLANFKVKALFGSHNATNGGKIVFNPRLIASSSYAPPPQATIIISSDSIQAGGVGLLEAPINLEFDFKQISTSVKPLAKKQCKNYDANRKWQDNWASQFDCAESKMVDGMLVSIKCTVCDTITNQVKRIVLKHNNLEKHMAK